MDKREFIWIRINDLGNSHFLSDNESAFDTVLLNAEFALVQISPITASANPSPSITLNVTGYFWSSAAGGGSFFVPASVPTSAAHEEDDDSVQTLLQILAVHLSLAFLSRSKTDTSDLESREWDRLVVGYLSLLCHRLWRILRQ
ncbi:hypothetical protein BT96DRAFT_333434 [Gymnopus androsaceus JB14]|uniref:Uncharacterized protein n=1 Tax=Gymnopus androsaceus JB14 TaxID=1447944 RepID=A0A6A4GZC5_9AGAR|nr:hypothetical protein BT96DRAFT_333434 [Gymnopus androsaceus JB14]